MPSNRGGPGRGQGRKDLASEVRKAEELNQGTDMKAHEQYATELELSGLHTDAVLAVTAAEYVKQWGRWAALRWAVKQGCPMRLVKLAFALERDVKNELWSN